MYRLKDVRYKDILFINHLEIWAQQITSIVGESGSGKTTLLRLLNKMISSDAGEITFQGKSLAEENSVQLRRQVVMLPQSPAIFSGTVRDNLLIGRKFAEQEPTSDDELKATLEMVHLSKALDDEAEKLSGGEKQRLGLARVLLMDPEVFLLDEPSSALDEATEELIIEKLVEHTRQKQKTLIMVTHSKGIAERYSDQMIQIKQGRVVERGGK